MTLPNQWALAAGAAVALAAAPAGAQTWVNPRTTPALHEIVAIDATGESGWPYGFEDLAGDGQTFKQQEQSIDIRTAYAATDAARFWARVYVSDPNAVGGNVTAYVFIDADKNPATGGSAAAAGIDAKFTTDPTAGGYEYVIEVRGNGSVPRIWSWKTPQNQFTSAAPSAAQAVGETGQDVDPIQLNGTDHGYLQANVDLALVGLTQACAANLFVRSSNAVPSSIGDLEVGKAGACVPADANGDGIPDVVVPSKPCSSSNPCPGGGVCVSGTCVIAVQCSTAADCPAVDQCTSDGRCVPKPTGSCSTNADCGALVCLGGVCSPCPLGGTECGSGEVCAPTGQCVTGTVIGAGGAGGAYALGAGEAVEGGACACALPGERRSGLAALAWLGAPLLLLCRRGARSKRASDAR
jgi:hypothetical protein